MASGTSLSEESGRTTPAKPWVDTAPLPVPDADPAGGPAGAERPSIGQVLRAARIAAGRSVEEVGDDTSVRVPIIEGIEQDDFSRCGGDFYARGHVRSLARAVGADADALVTEFDEAHGGTSAAARPLPLPLFEPSRMNHERRRPSWAGAMVAAIVVVAAVIGFNLADGRSKDTAAEAAVVPSPSASGPAKPLVVLRPTMPAAPVRTAPPAAPAAPLGVVTVKLTADAADSWLEVADTTGRTFFEGDLAKGASQSYTDPKGLQLVLGNASGVHLWVNGKDVGRPGAAGQVVQLAYTPSDFRKAPAAPPAAAAPAAPRASAAPAVPAPPPASAAAAAAAVGSAAPLAPAAPPASAASVR
ncbi:helix-turn-helix domain-containing protein [Streptacidiphilus albus]|uniref:helix-turn-helix domain-containing protein n=2 Tax=Streptacidiphilus albus TaxID=105425 RepID=UPI0006906348|nr:helix-turn-helix domain-containing protein [Streptacidiphilus albus]